MCQILNMLGFWIFQVCQYARVLSFQGYTGFTYFRKYDKVLSMRRDSIMEEFAVFQDSEYATFLHMQALHKVLNMSEDGWLVLGWTVLTVVGFWICLGEIWQGFECASSSKHARAQIMASLWICKGYTWCWIWLNNTSICVNKVTV